jgi:hypothetical protein
MDDSVRGSHHVVGRRLTVEEMGYFESRGFKPPQKPLIAFDALAFIINPANPDSVFTVDQMRDLLTGKYAKWNQLNPKSKLGAVQVVFDNPLSGTLRYVKDSIIGNGMPLTTAASAVKTNAEVINYVKQNKNAIGIIAANWISDTDDAVVCKNSCTRSGLPTSRGRRVKKLMGPIRRIWRKINTRSGVRCTSSTRKGGAMVWEQVLLPISPAMPSGSC